MAVVNLDLYSYELAMNTQVAMILPERRGVRHEIHPGDYPVLYLLHGHGQDYTSWLRLSRIDLYLQQSDVIVVMPNTNRGFYVDGDRTHRYGSYLAVELPTALRNWFHITGDREKTFIAGMSMGGYGSMHAAFSHPEEYGAVCAMSTCIRMSADISKGQADKGLAIPDMPEVAQNFENVFGPDELYDGGEYDLKALVKKLDGTDGPKPRLLQLCGTEDPLLEQNEDFAAYVKENCPHLDCRFETSPGVHDFYYWDSQCRTMLEFFGII